MTIFILGLFFLWCVWSGWNIGFIMAPLNFVLGYQLAKFLGL